MLKFILSLSFFLMTISSVAQANGVPNVIYQPVVGSGVFEVPLDPSFSSTTQHVSPSLAVKLCLPKAQAQNPNFKFISIKLVKNQEAGCFLPKEQGCVWTCASAIVSTQ